MCPSLFQRCVRGHLSCQRGWQGNHFDTHHFLHVDFVHFSFMNQTSNDFFSVVNGSLVARVDRHVSFFVDINLNACFSDDFIDSFPTIDNNLILSTSILIVSIFGCSWSQFLTNFRNRCFNHVKGFQTSFLAWARASVKISAVIPWIWYPFEGL